MKHQVDKTQMHANKSVIYLLIYYTATRGINFKWLLMTVPVQFLVGWAPRPTLWELAALSTLQTEGWSPSCVLTALVPCCRPNSASHCNYQANCKYRVQQTVNTGCSKLWICWRRFISDAWRL